MGNRRSGSPTIPVLQRNRHDEHSQACFRDDHSVATPVYLRDIALPPCLGSLNLLVLVTRLNSGVMKTTLMQEATRPNLRAHRTPLHHLETFLCSGHSELKLYFPDSNRADGVLGRRAPERKYLDHQGRFEGLGKEWTAGLTNPTKSSRGPKQDRSLDVPLFLGGLMLKGGMTFT